MTGRILRIPPSSAVSFQVEKDQVVKVTDIEGQQAADFIAFNARDLREKLSTSRTRSENGTVRITKGHRLFSNRHNVLFTILEDKCGVHDILYPPCSRWVFENRYRIPPHDGCLENLARVLSSWSLDALDLPDPFNIFENSHLDEKGGLSIKDPASKPGDFVEMKAEMDCLVAISACAVDVGHTNAGRCKPIEVTMR